MLKANEILILSYIKKYNRIDLYDIQKTINQPLVQLVNSISKLFEKEYIFINEGDCFYINEDKNDENIVSWDEWVLKFKKNNSDSIIGNNIYDGILNENGFPEFVDTTQLNKILKLKGIDIKAYHEFYIYSQNKVRTITAPSIYLKDRQRWILRNILEKIEIEHCVHGFVKGKSIKTNAECHLNKKEILCIDIENFFPSIRNNKIIDVFLKLAYSPAVAQRLTEICTYKEVLPQGAPTSPYLANIVFRQIDQKLIKLASENNLIYTRYADDLTFSSDLEIEPFLKTIETIIYDNGFSINPDKTHIMKDNYREMITGLVVKHDVRVPASFKKKLRQEIYYCNKFGISQHLQAIGRNTSVNFREYLYGKAYYIKMIEKENGEMFLKQLDRIFSIL